MTTGTQQHRSLAEQPSEEGMTQQHRSLAEQPSEEGTHGEENAVVTGRSHYFQGTIGGHPTAKTKTIMNDHIHQDDHDDADVTPKNNGSSDEEDEQWEEVEFATQNTTSSHDKSDMNDNTEVCHIQSIVLLIPNKNMITIY